AQIPFGPAVPHVELAQVDQFGAAAAVDVENGAMDGRALRRVARAGVAEVDFSRLADRHRNLAAVVEIDLDAFAVELPDGGVSAVGNPALVVRFAPLQTISNGDGAVFGGVGAQAFPATRVETNLVAVRGTQGENIVIDGRDGQVGALGNLLHL